MARISFKKFVKVTSGIASLASARRRDLNLRVFTANASVPYGVPMTVQDSTWASEIFGESAGETNVATNYLGYVSPSVTAPDQISFVRWLKDALPQDTGTALNIPMELKKFTGDVGFDLVPVEADGSQSAGKFAAHILLSFGEGESAESYTSVEDLVTRRLATHSTLTNLGWLKASSLSYAGGKFYFTTSGSGSGVAAVHQLFRIAKYNTVNQETDLGTADSGAEVLGFVNDFGDSSEFTAWSGMDAYSIGDVVSHDHKVYVCKANIPAPAGATPNVWNPDDWDLTSNVYSQSELAAETPAEAVKRVNEMDDNFGMIMFMESLSHLEAKKIAAANKSFNYKYIFFYDCKKANYTDYGTEAGALWGFDCVHGVYCNYHDEHAAWAPSAALGSTKYDRANTTKTLMFKQFSGLTPSVGIKTDEIGWYKKLDAARLNYYGETMKSGAALAFYQDGVSMNGVDTACEFNEIWLKDACETEIINFLISMEKVPANDTGVQMLSLIVLSVINEALKNGTIIKGKPLSQAEKIKCDTLFGQEGAWKVVYNDGYKFQAQLSKTTKSGAEKWCVSYILAYLKGDAIKFVEGSDIMY